MVLGTLSFSPALMESVSQMQQLSLNILDGVWGTSTLIAEETIPPNTTGTSLFSYSWPEKRNIKKMKKTFASVNFSFWAVWKQVCLLGNTEGHSICGSCTPASHASWFFMSRPWSRKYCFWLPSFQEPNGFSAIILDWGFLCYKFTACFLSLH